MGEDGGRDGQGVWDGHVYSMFEMDDQQGATVEHVGLLGATCSLDWRGLGGAWIQACAGPSAFTVHLKPLQNY